MRSKYNNIKTKVDGFTFDSKAEASRYQELKLLRQAGAIQYFNRQPSFLFNSGIRYIADFMVCDNDGQVWVEDVKGVETQAFKIKKAMFANEYPYLELIIIT